MALFFRDSCHPVSNMSLQAVPLRVAYFLFMFKSLNLPRKQKGVTATKAALLEHQERLLRRILFSSGYQNIISTQMIQATEQGLSQNLELHRKKIIHICDLCLKSKRE